MRVWTDKARQPACRPFLEIPRSVLMGADRGLLSSPPESRNAFWRFLFDLNHDVMRGGHVPAEQCPQGHQIRTAADRDKQGYCRQCRREKRASDSAAVMVVRALERAGARFRVDGKPLDPADFARELSEAYLAGELNFT
uniref:Uncharacterized protein n=8 Tax=unclassified Caudoviricetes TaxID=2788787 RepID=A0AB39U290_9CAUD